VRQASLPARTHRDAAVGEPLAVGSPAAVPEPASVSGAATITPSPAAGAASATGRPGLVPGAQLREMFDGLAPAAVNADVRLLEHNVESWVSMWSALTTEPGGIDATYFIMQRDVFGMAYLGALLDRARQGEPVRLLLDAVGDLFGRRGFTQTFRGQDYLQELQAAGADVRVYNPIHKKVARNIFQKNRPWAGLANNHDKLLLVGQTAITGGRNISRDYFTDPADRADVYRDTDVLIRGQAAAQAMKKIFEREFDEEALHFKVYGDMFGNWSPKDLELLGARHMMDLWLNDARPLGAEEKRALLQDEPTREAAAEALVQGALACLKGRGVDRAPGFFENRALMKLARELVGYPELRGAHAAYDPREGLHRGVELKPLDRASAASREGENELGPVIQQLASGAEERLIFQNPYVVLTWDAIEALRAAGQRGVKIDLLTNSPDSTDSLVTQAFFVRDWKYLLAEIPNLRIFVFTGEQKLHAKVAQADDRLALVSSFNLDLLSEQINGEIGAVVWSEKLARDVRKSFEADLANPANKVREYTIQRDEAGRPVRGPDGAPLVQFGPEDHISTWTKVKYGALSWLANEARKLPALEALRHPALEPGALGSGLRAPQQVPAWNDR
jgi:putative cardiolipin synthase